MDLTKNELIILQNAVQSAINITHNIEQVAMSSGVLVTDMPPATLPTHELYDMLACFVALYSKAIDAAYIKTGNLKSTRNNIH